MYNENLINKMIKDNEFDGCTILFKPKSRVLKGLREENISTIFKNFGITIETFLIFDLKDFYAISILDANLPSDIINIFSENFADKIYEVYQCNFTENELQLIINNKISFEFILGKLNIKQSVLARRLGLNRQVLTNIKKGRSLITINILGKLIQLYPYMPWLNYIKSKSVNIEEVSEDGIR